MVNKAQGEGHQIPPGYGLSGDFWDVGHLCAGRGEGAGGWWFLNWAFPHLDLRSLHSAIHTTTPQTLHCKHFFAGNILNCTTEHWEEIHVFASSRNKDRIKNGKKWICFDASAISRYRGQLLDGSKLSLLVAVNHSLVSVTVGHREWICSLVSSSLCIVAEHLLGASTPAPPE